AVDRLRGVENQRRSIADFDVIAVETGDLWIARGKPSLLEHAHVHEEAIEKDVHFSLCHGRSPRSISHLDKDGDVECPRSCVMAYVCMFTMCSRLTSAAFGCLCQPAAPVGISAAHACARESSLAHPWCRNSSRCWSHPRPSAHPSTA